MIICSTDSDIVQFLKGELESFVDCYRPEYLALLTTQQPTIKQQTRFNVLDRTCERLFASLDEEAIKGHTNEC